MLGNFLFKVITKIITSHLGDVAARIISPNQFGFVKGRQIQDCMTVASDCINALDKCCYRGNIAIKIDIRKAFDTMNRDYILKVLSCFGFSNNFIQWIQEIFLLAIIFLLMAHLRGFLVAIGVSIWGIHFLLFYFA